MGFSGKKSEVGIPTSVGEQSRNSDLGVEQSRNSDLGWRGLGRLEASMPGRWRAREASMPGRNVARWVSHRCCSPREAVAPRRVQLGEVRLVQPVSLRRLRWASWGCSPSHPAQYGICLLSQKMSMPTEGDMRTLKHLVSCLTQTTHRMLVFDEPKRGVGFAGESPVCTTDIHAHTCRTRSKHIARKSQSR